MIVTAFIFQRWKDGKRRAEKDEYVGGSLFLTMTVPQQPLDHNDVNDRIEHFGQFAKTVDDSVRGFYAMADDLSKKMRGRELWLAHVQGRGGGVGAG